MLLLGYLYFRIAGEAYALVSIGLISFAAVAQFAPALLGGMYWRGGTRAGALAGLLGGFALWVYTLMLPSVAKSGWMPAGFVERRALRASRCSRPSSCSASPGSTTSPIRCSGACWSTSALYVGLSLWRAPSAREASQALLFVDVFERAAGGGAAARCSGAAAPGSRPAARSPSRFLGAEPGASGCSTSTPARRGVAEVERPRRRRAAGAIVERQLAGAIGSASARVMVAVGRRRRSRSRSTT